MYKFEDLSFESNPFGGIRARMFFDNGFGVSVVKSEHSYGGNEGLYEMAVLGPDGHINYDTPITSDVLGYLSPEEVSKAMSDVQDLAKTTDISFEVKK